MIDRRKSNWNPVKSFRLDVRWRNEWRLFAPLRSERVWLRMLFEKGRLQRDQVWLGLRFESPAAGQWPTPASNRALAELGFRFGADRVHCRYPAASRLRGLDVPRRQQVMAIRKLWLWNEIEYVAWDWGGGQLIFQVIDWYAAASHRLGTEAAGTAGVLDRWYTMLYETGTFAR